MELTPLNIALVALALAGVWAIVEVALTLRTTRKKLDELTTSINTTIEEVQPIIAKLDGVVDEVNPAVKQVEPLLGKVGNAVDAVTLDLIRVDDILGDVSGVTGSASHMSSNVSGAVSRAAASASDAATGLFGRISNKTKQTQANLGAAPTPQDIPEDVIVPVDSSRGYFTYGAKPTAAPEESESVAETKQEETAAPKRTRKAPAHQAKTDAKASAKKPARKKRASKHAKADDKS